MLIGVADGEVDPLKPPPDMPAEQALLEARKLSFKFAHDFERMVRVVQVRVCVYGPSA